MVASADEEEVRQGEEDPPSTSEDDEDMDKWKGADMSAGAQQSTPASNKITAGVLIGTIILPAVLLGG